MLRRLAAAVPAMETLCLLECGCKCLNPEHGHRGCVNSRGSSGDFPPRLLHSPVATGVLATCESASLRVGQVEISLPGRAVSRKLAPAFHRTAVGADGHREALGQFGRVPPPSPGMVVDADVVFP